MLGEKNCWRQYRLFNLKGVDDSEIKVSALQHSVLSDAVPVGWLSCLGMWSDAEWSYEHNSGKDSYRVEVIDE